MNIIDILADLGVKIPHLYVPVCRKLGQQIGAWWCIHNPRNALCIQILIKKYYKTCYGANFVNYRL